ncbi:MAG: 4-hydroxyphenylacetate 3-hydroxylase family protein [Chloroflexi bacterium]|nr:4-hydroxyphenylacetate 3-hydroxylase family protein [Chloroflexota bacterium]
MMTGEEYRQSLRRLQRPVYALGERVEDVASHPLFQDHINAAALTYDLAHDPQHQELLTATSHLSGKRINRFTHIQQNTDDLMRKVQMLRLLGQITGSCFQRCAGLDALNAVYNATYQVDQKYGTDYHRRARSYVSYVQNADLMCEGGMTDPKGDRSLRPSQQADPDLYMHVVERREDGIVVRGAKLHQTGAVNSHEVIVMPTTALREDDRDYAVSFAVPSDAPGLVFIFGRQTNDQRKLNGELDQGNALYGYTGGEAMVVFNDVFVPWERVFLCGEHDFALVMLEYFSCYHRTNYGGCKAGVADVLIGATALLAEFNGVAGNPVVRDKLVEMVHLAETLYACATGASATGRATPAGGWWVNPLMANTTKLNTARFTYDLLRLAHDVAGGSVATLPSERDLQHPEVGKYLEKYLRGAGGVPAQHRIRLFRLVEALSSCPVMLEAVHGAGSPMTQRIPMLRQAELEKKIALARKLAGIPATGEAQTRG